MMHTGSLESHSPAVGQEPNWFLRKLVPAGWTLFGLGLLCGIAWWIRGPIFSLAALESLQRARRADVRSLLGAPTEVQPFDTWVYRRPFNPGWIAISFDGSGRVSFISDRQPHPELFGDATWVEYPRLADSRSAAPANSRRKRSRR